MSTNVFTQLVDTIYEPKQPCKYCKLILHINAVTHSVSCSCRHVAQELVKLGRCIALGKDCALPLSNLRRRPCMALEHQQWHGY